MTTEDWQEIYDGIKEAENFLKPLGVTFPITKKITLDVSNPFFYHVSKSWSGKKLKDTKSIHGAVIRSLGESYLGKTEDYYGLIVDKSKSLETESLYGQHSDKFKTIEVYAKKTKRKYFGLSFVGYNLVHEALHAYAYYKGIPDLLHDYLATKPKSLIPFMERLIQKPYDVILKRGYDNKTQIMGAIDAKGFTCFTLELAWKDNKSNISAIPKGTYTCKYTYSSRFKKKTYEILNVPNRSGIRIHSGNYHTQINGCILLGLAIKDINNDKQLDVIRSTEAITAFEKHMEYKDFTLVIE